MVKVVIPQGEKYVYGKSSDSTVYKWRLYSQFKNMYMVKVLTSQNRGHLANGEVLEILHYNAFEHKNVWYALVKRFGYLLRFVSQS